MLPEIIKGYAYINLDGETIIDTDFEIKAQIIEANPNVIDCAGKVAVRRGVYIYCAESVDNGENISTFKISTDTEFTAEYDETYHAHTLTCTAYKPTFDTNLLYRSVRPMEKTTLRLIPYYAFATRGECEMVVWLGRRD